MRRIVPLWTVCAFLLVLPVAAAGQSGATPPGSATSQAGQGPQVPVFIGPPPPPATRLEAFIPPSGAVLTVGYDDLGDVAGISVEVREMSDTNGGRVRGVVVSIGERRSPRELSYIDADELPDLIRAFDTLLTINSNPTPFRSFEVRYATRGELALIASSRNRAVAYRVEVGRVVRVASAPLNGGELNQLRAYFEAASQKLATIPPIR